MPSIKELRVRIRSLQNTRKITSAMKLVASSKLRKSQDAQRGNLPYTQHLDSILKRVLSSAGVPDLALCANRPIKTIQWIIIASERGLCGSFNHNLARKTMEQVSQQAYGPDVHVQIHALGKKTLEYFQRHARHMKVDLQSNIAGGIAFGPVHNYVKSCMEDFLTGKVDEIHVAYNRYNSLLSQTPEFFRLLPLQLPEQVSEVQSEYIFEPSAPRLLGELLPKLVASLLFQAVLDSTVGENAARMTAMDNAARNARKLIDKLTLQMNRARQAAITTELSEIVAGAESL